MKIALESDQYYRFYADDGFYRYTFNGKENENEIASSDLDFGARIYDARLGRWLSCDPHYYNYRSSSPYNMCLNNPLSNVDVDGRDVYSIQWGIRGVVVVGTGALAIGLALDDHGNIGMYVMGNFGVGAGLGVAAGLSFGWNWEADKLDDVAGWGYSIGGFAGAAIFTPFELGFEKNGGFRNSKGTNNLFDHIFSPDTEILDGASVGLPIPGTGTTFGVAGYADLSYTHFLWQANILDLAQGFYSQMQSIDEGLRRFDGTLIKMYGTNLDALGLNPNEMSDSIIKFLVDMGAMEAPANLLDPVIIKDEKPQGN